MTHSFFDQADLSTLQFVAQTEIRKCSELASQEKSHSDSHDEYQVNPKILTYGLNEFLMYMARCLLILLHKSALHSLQ